MTKPDNISQTDIQLEQDSLEPITGIRFHSPDTFCEEDYVSLLRKQTGVANYVGQNSALKKYFTKSLSTSQHLPVAVGYKAVLDTIECLRAPEATDWQIDKSVYEAATRFATRLRGKHVPPPAVFTHGPDALVLSWAEGDMTYYVTIGESRTALMVCDPTGVVRRGAGPNDNLQFGEMLAGSLGQIGFLQAADEMD